MRRPVPALGEDNRRKSKHKDQTYEHDRYSRERENRGERAMIHRVLLGLVGWMFSPVFWLPERGCVYTARSRHIFAVLGWETGYHYVASYDMNLAAVL